MMEIGTYFSQNAGTALNSSSLGFMLSSTPETPRVPVRSQHSNPFAWHTPDASPTHITADGHRLSGDSTNTDFMYTNPSNPFYDNGSPSSLMNFSSTGSTPVHCPPDADGEFLNSGHWCMADVDAPAECNSSDDDEAMDCDYTPATVDYPRPTATSATPATTQYLRQASAIPATPTVNALLPGNAFTSPVRTVRGLATPSPVTNRVRPIASPGPSFRAPVAATDLNDESFLFGLTAIRVPRPTIDDSTKAPGQMTAPASPCNRQFAVNEAFATVIPGV